MAFRSSESHLPAQDARHSRGRSVSGWAQRSFVRDLQISILVATWTVILSLPVIIWPWAEYMLLGHFPFPIY